MKEWESESKDRLELLLNDVYCRPLFVRHLLENLIHNCDDYHVLRA